MRNAQLIFIFIRCYKLLNGILLLVVTIQISVYLMCYNLFIFPTCCRPHHISTLRLTMILCLVLTVAISFSLPVVEAGAHYHYDPFYRVCWLPTNTEHNMEIRFVLFVSRKCKEAHTVTSEQLLDAKITELSFDFEFLQMF